MRGKGGKRAPRNSQLAGDLFKTREPFHSDTVHVSNVGPFEVGAFERTSDKAYSYRDPEKSVPEQEIVVFLQNIAHMLNACDKPCTHIQCTYVKKIAELNGRILLHGVKP